MVEVIGPYMVRAARKKEGCVHNAGTLHYKNQHGQILFVKDFANIEFARYTARTWAVTRPVIPKYEWRDDEIHSRN